MVSIDRIERGIAKYFDVELKEKLPPNGFERVFVGTAISIAIKRSGRIIAEMKDNKAVQMLGIMDDKGNVDIDILRDEVKNQMPESGIKVDLPLIGMMTFKKEDIDILYSYINE